MIFPLNSTTEQTVTETITMSSTQYKTYTFTFDKLKEVKGIKQITKNSASTYGSAQTITTLGAVANNTNNSGSLFNIHDNVVEFTIYNSVNQSSTAIWEITVVGV